MSSLPLKKMAELMAMSIDERFALAKAAVKLEKTAKTTSTEHKSAFKPLGKVIASLKAAYNQAVAGNAIPSTTSFADYYTAHAGAKPNNHGMSCAGAWASYVESGKISEADYDGRPAHALEKANAVVTATKHDLTHKAVDQVAEVLKDRQREDAEAYKAIKAILATVKPQEKLTAEEVCEMLAEIPEEHVGLIIARLDSIPQQAEGEAKQNYFALVRLSQKIESAVGPGTAEAWIDEFQSMTAPVEILTETREAVAA